MSCARFRESLTEHALGVLQPDSAREVENHLERCESCRKEAGDLWEAAGVLAFDLAPAEPPARLEEQIVRTVSGSSTRRPRRSGRGRGRRRLAVASLAAAVLLAASFSWAVAMRGQVADLKDRATMINRKLERTLALRQRLQGKGESFEAHLWTRQGQVDAGTAILFSSQKEDDFLFIEVASLPSNRAPYSVRVDIRSSPSLTFGRLKRTNNGTFVLAPRNFFPVDLSKAESVSVLDRAGEVVLAGAVQPFRAPAVS